MANSVDPDQTAPLGLHCLLRPVCPKIKDHYGSSTLACILPLVSHSQICGFPPLAGLAGE